jgi:hypothetical protein
MYRLSTRIISVTNISSIALPPSITTTISSLLGNTPFTSSASDADQRIQSVTGSANGLNTSCNRFPVQNVEHTLSPKFSSTTVNNDSTLEENQK